MNGLVFEGFGLAPAAALLAAVLAVAALIAIRRPLARRVVVAFGPLWARARRNARPGLPWREALALLVFVAALAAVAGGLAGPVIAARPPRAVALVVDASASMQSRDAEGRRRIDLAKLAAARIVRSAAPGDRVAVFRASSSTRALAPFDIAAIEPDDGAADAGAAMAAARAWLARDGASGTPPERRVVVLSDRPESFGEAGEGVELDRIPVGTPGENLSIAAFSVAPGTASEGGLDLRVTIANHGGSDASADVALHTERFRLGGARLEVPAGARVTRAFHLPAAPGPELWASLDGVAFANGAVDALARDDRRGVWVLDRGVLEVALVTTAPNRFLEGALAVQGGVRVRTLRPSQAHAAALADSDVVVLDGVSAPASLPPRVSGVLRIDAGGKAKRIPAPTLTDWNGEHPVTAPVSLDQLTLADATLLSPENRDVVLASVQQGPIALAREWDDGVRTRREVRLGFDPVRSDFPLRLGFPVFVGGAVRWLAGVDGGHRMLAGPAGRSLPIDAAEARISRAAVDPFGRTGGNATGTAPDSLASARIRPRGAALAFSAERAGLYSVETPEGAWHVEIAVPAEESDPSVASSVREPALPGWAGEVPDSPRRPLGALLFAAAAVLLAWKAWL